MKRLKMTFKTCECGNVYNSELGCSRCKEKRLRKKERVYNYNKKQKIYKKNLKSMRKKYDEKASDKKHKQYLERKKERLKKGNELFVNLRKKESLSHFLRRIKANEIKLAEKFKEKSFQETMDEFDKKNSS